MSQLQKGDIVIRAYAHDHEEWGVVIDLETVVIDPRHEAYPEDTAEIDVEHALEYIYVTVLWPGYTTQEIDYELWTPKEAIDYAVKYHEKQSKK